MNAILHIVGQIFLLLETLEGVEHAASRLLGRGQVLQSGLIGGRFLRAALGEQPSHDDAGAALHDGLPALHRLAARPPPATPPATIAPMPRTCVSRARVWSFAMRARKAAMWPPAMWPLSCAMTPMTSFGVFACISVPVWTKTLAPSRTKALNVSLLTMRTVTRPPPNPAAWKIGLA